MSLTLTGQAALAATVQEQTFEDAAWDERPDQTIDEAIDQVLEAHPYLFDLRGLDITRTRRTAGYFGRGLTVSIPSGGFRGFGPYARLPEVVDQAWFRYYLRLDEFRPVSSGKLPGLADASTAYTAKGCFPSTESAPGWSARLLFDAMGSHGVSPGEVPIGLYLYHLGQERNCGDEHIFGSLVQDRWTCIEGMVRMNTPGSADGAVAAWIDGRNAFQRSNLQFRRPGESIGVREMWNNVYFGGSYATPYPLHLTLDQMVVSDSGRVGCLDPFIDDNHTVHESALTELYARGLLFGCEERLACPEDRLTRGQFAAMMHRLLRPPPGPDAFVDDDGHWAEAVFNSLAAAGILRGCDPPANTRACPDDTVTRAQVGVIVRRALNLPGSSVDAFSDDDGSWAENDINAIAAAGITRGCRDGEYCPNDVMKRMEAATFLVRSDNLIAVVATLAELPEWPPAGPPPEKPVEERE